jgi:hypothetical protein
MASREILLIAQGSGLLALDGPKFDLLVFVCVVLLARFRGWSPGSHRSRYIQPRRVG